MADKKNTRYLIPKSLESGTTSLGQVYEVNIENGIKVLNSENANYSFGSLHQIMLKGLTEVLKKLKPQNILMLGLGAGSALAILEKKCNWPFSVTVIEIDSDLVKIAEKHFGLGTYNNLKLLKGDALKEIKKIKEKFDLVIDDIFWDNKVPGFCLTDEYLSDNRNLLSSEGIYMRNIMNMDKPETMDYEKKLMSAFADIKMSRHADFGNSIYFCSV